MGRAPTETKQKLIDTALELLWKNSYGSVSVDGICETAGINKGSFYYYFKSKSELAVAALENHCRLSEARFEEAYATDNDPVKRITAMADALYEEQREVLEKYGQVCGCPFMTLGVEMAGQDEVIRQKVEDVHHEYQAYMETAVRDLVEDDVLPPDTDIESRALQVNSFILGQITLARILNSLEPLESNLKEGMFRIIGIHAEEGAHA